jgi:hypothetical protein
MQSASSDQFESLMILLDFGLPWWYILKYNLKAIEIKHPFVSGYSEQKSIQKRFIFMNFIFHSNTFN